MSAKLTPARHSCKPSHSSRAHEYLGSITLLHDGIDFDDGADRSATVEATKRIVASLQERGYRFVTVHALLSLQGRYSHGQRAVQSSRVPLHGTLGSTPSDRQGVLSCD